MNVIAYHNRIIAYWHYGERIPNATYECFINGKLVGNTKVTHYSFVGLKPSTDYEIEIKVKDKTISSINVKTEAAPNTIIVSDIDNTGTIIVTKELQSIIDKATYNDVIVFPKGTYLTGALFLHNGTRLYLEEGAVIKGSPNKEDYLPKIVSRFEGTHLDCYASLLNAGTLNINNKPNVKDIRIFGKGSIIGGGKALAEDIINEEIKYLSIEEKEDAKVNDRNKAGRRRGRLINLSNADNVVIDGLKLGQSPSWNVHFIYSSNIVITGCHFDSFGKYGEAGVHNGDGIDPDSSHDIDIFDIDFNTGDDCIAIKSGKNPEGNIINIPTYNVNIFDCRTTAGHGCSIGSELSGGIYDIYIYDSDFLRTRYGLHIKTTKKRGGYCKNVIVDNCSFSSVNIRTVPYNDDGIAASSITKFSHFRFNNLTLGGFEYESERVKLPANAINVKGFEDYQDAFNDITFDNVTILEKGDCDKLISNCTNVTIDNVY